jgi:glycosyltransferase involved in cell wall biosynthesis
MKISIILPYKENFSSDYAGAVSLLLRDTVKLSEYRSNIKIFGNTEFKKDLLKKNYINLPIKRRFFQSVSKFYLNQFEKYEINDPSQIIEIHNRPLYVKKIFKINKNIVLFFHNDPLSMKGSISPRDRIKLLRLTKKIIFVSKWVKNRFFFNINNYKKKNSKYEIIPNSTNKVKINFKNKKNLIVFAGRLNLSKGYDIFGKAVLKILDKHKDWKAIVYGDEPRENILFKHNNLKILGFKKHSVVLKKLITTSISVVCSRWEEPFGRTAMEASSRGCAVIISNRGGLPEAASHPIKLKSFDHETLFKAIDKLIINKKYRTLIQKKTHDKFVLTNKLISRKLDDYRKKLIKF